MIDADTPEGQWFHRLARELHDRRVGRHGTRVWSRQTVGTRRVRPPLDVLDDYRQGDPPLRPDVHSGWKPHVRQFMRMGRLNMADLLISSTSNRLSLRDFRTAAADDELGDQRARAIMRANALKVVSREVHETALCMADAYTMVTPGTGRRREAFITAEDPREAITVHDPATGQPLAGLKMFRNEWDDEDLAYLVLPGRVLPARRRGISVLTDRGPLRLGLDSWEWDVDRAQTVPGGGFPLVRFRNRDGVGEYERHLDTLDRINDKIFDEWWVAKIQAFRQRAVKNLPDTKDELDAEGRTIQVPVADDEYDDMFTNAPDEMWQVPGDVDFWESSPVDLTPITNAIEKDRARLASVTSTPLHIITPDAAAGSAEGAALLREEHLFKVQDRRDRFESSWAQVMSLAFAFEGDTERADLSQIEPQWGPIERHSLEQRAQAASQAGTTLPVEVIQRDIWQYDPAEIPEIRKLRGRDMIFNTRAAPLPDSTVTGPIPTTN